VAGEAEGHAARHANVDCHTVMSIALGNADVELVKERDVVIKAKQKTA
jgi:hypothetical protein